MQRFCGRHRHGVHWAKMTFLVGILGWLGCPCSGGFGGYVEAQRTSEQLAYYPQQPGFSWYFVHRQAQESDVDAGTIVHYRQHLERLPTVVWARLIDTDPTIDQNIDTPLMSSSQWRLQVTTITQPNANHSRDALQDTTAISTATSVSKDILAYTAGGVFWYGTLTADALVQYVPPLLLYKTEPLTVGDQWTSETDIVLVPLKGKVQVASALDQRIVFTVTVQRLQGITTSKGRFNCLFMEQVTAGLYVATEDDKHEKDESEKRHADVETVRYSCFVPTVGVVAQGHTPELEMVLEATSFFP